MDGDLGATIEHGPLHLLREHALAADRVQRDVAGLCAVAERLDQHQLGLDAMCTESIGDRLCLGASLGATPCGDPDRGHGTRRHARVQPRSNRSATAAALRSPRGDPA